MLAKQLVQLRKQKTRTYAASSKVKSIGIQNKAMGANAKLAQAMGTASKTMGDMNRLMKPEQVMATVNAFGKESMKMDMTEEMSKDCCVCVAKRLLLLIMEGEVVQLFFVRLDCKGL